MSCGVKLPGQAPPRQSAVPPPRWLARRGRRERRRGPTALAPPAAASGRTSRSNRSCGTPCFGAPRPPPRRTARELQARGPSRRVRAPTPEPPDSIDPPQRSWRHWRGRSPGRCCTSVTLGRGCVAVARAGRRRVRTAIRPDALLAVQGAVIQAALEGMTWLLDAESTDDHVVRHNGGRCTWRFTFRPQAAAAATNPQSAVTRRGIEARPQGRSWPTGRAGGGADRSQGPRHQSFPGMRFTASRVRHPPVTVADPMGSVVGSAPARFPNRSELFGGAESPQPSGFATRRTPPPDPYGLPKKTAMQPCRPSRWMGHWRLADPRWQEAIPIG